MKKNAVYLDNLSFIRITNKFFYFHCMVSNPVREPGFERRFKVKVNERTSKPLSTIIYVYTNTILDYWIYNDHLYWKLKLKKNRFDHISRSFFLFYFFFVGEDLISGIYDLSQIERW